MDDSSTSVIKYNIMYTYNCSVLEHFLFIAINFMFQIN